MNCDQVICGQSCVLTETRGLVCWWGRRELNVQLNKHLDSDIQQSDDSQYMYHHKSLK